MFKLFQLEELNLSSNLINSSNPLTDLTFESLGKIRRLKRLNLSRN